LQPRDYSVSFEVPSSDFPFFARVWQKKLRKSSLGNYKSADGSFLLGRRETKYQDVGVLRLPPVKINAEPANFLVAKSAIVTLQERSGQKLEVLSFNADLRT